MKEPSKSLLTPSKSRSLVVLGALALVTACASGQNHGPSKASQGAGQQVRPSANAVIIPAPTPQVAASNLLRGAQLFVDPTSLAKLTADAMRDENPADAKLLDTIAEQPMGLWIGGWNSDVYRTVQDFTNRAREANSVPVMIAYNIPLRDCGQESGGGLKTKEEYQRWIRNIQAGIGDNPAVVVLEPDALGHFQECLSQEQKDDRMFLLSDAVKVLRQNPKTAVYLDAGHARWVKADEMAVRLRQAGVQDANGFSLNVSNYVSTEENLEYGRELSKLSEGAHFIIDTSRNGAGPYEEAKTPKEAWCNPPGRKVGQLPTTDTGDELCQGYLWLKRPGESDGKCNGGPVAGAFWTERALSMVQ